MFGHSYIRPECGEVISLRRTRKYERYNGGVDTHRRLMASLINVRI